MHTQTLKQLSDALSKKEVSSVELTTHFLERIKQLDKNLNAFITVDEQGAMAAAKAADQLIKQGNHGPLTGLPIAHKDLLCTQGIKTSCASKMLDNFISPYDATVVANLKQAGCVMLGKTNMDEFAMGSSNETSFYGPAKNPWDTARTPGGSSGGSAAAVAGRLVPAATGTDTGGSIRQPAAMTGITGLKPTYGRISRYGMVAFASSLDQAGPMTLTAYDAAMMLQAMAGFDPKDSTSAEQAVPHYCATIDQPIKGLKIGLPKEYFEFELEKDVEKALLDAIEVLKAQGAQIIEISLPSIKLCVPVYYIVASAECSSNLSRFDGVRYGYRCDSPANLEDLYTRTRGEGFGDEVKRRIMAGTYALSAGYFDAFYLKAQKVRMLIAQEIQAAFDKVDCLLGPTTPTPAFKIGEKIDDPIKMYLNDIFTIAANLAGLPAISLPCGMSNQLPVSLQLMGKHFDESLLLQVAHNYQQQTDWHTLIPKAFD